MGETIEPPLLDNSRVTVLDVRPMVERGEEPFERIQQALQQLSEEQTLLLVAPFDPRPLKQFVTRQGFVFDYREPTQETTWMAIYRGEERSRPELSGEAPSAVLPVSGGFAYVLDCRALSPPQPLEWTGEVLDGLAPGDLLVQHNDRRPQLLLENLEHFDWEVYEDGVADVRVEFTPRGE